MKAHTIDEAATYLQTIIQDCTRRASCLGYFASLYLKMTLAVKVGIGDQVFEDGFRMERLVVSFANRYLDAYTQYHVGQAPKASWKAAFDASTNVELTIVQHLLLGINAHINPDLGIAAAEISTKDNIHLLRPDFQKINDTIADEYNKLQGQLARISWLTILIAKIKPETTDTLINFSVTKARDTAWNNALILANSSMDLRNSVISSTDKIVARVANGIQSPGKIASFLFKWMLKSEQKDVAANLGLLDEIG